MKAVRGRYGIDAPAVPLGLVSGGVALLILAAVAAVAGWGTSAVAGCTFGGASMLASAGLYLHTTLRGKFEIWQRLLDQLELAGDERVLDLGCGRGAVLVAAAARVPNGRAIGVDVWRSVDQSGNRPEAARANAVTAGVDDQVELHTADLTDLPFADHSFDVVLSSLAIHNIGDPDARDRAVDEAARVLRPGGRIVIVDILHTRRYATRLAEHSLTARRRPLGYRFWYGGPWMAAQVITADR
jgi:ubiquinone/menaquinone biosynthesis C-methylase UbiE